MITYTNINNCTICKSKEISEFSNVKDDYKTTDKIHKYFICINCEHIFLKEKPKKKFFDKIYPEHYLSYINNENNFSFYKVIKDFGDKKKVSNIIKLYKKINNSKKNKKIKIFEIGCGTGDFLLQAKKMGIEIFGLEPSKHTHKTLKKRSIKFVGETIEDISINKKFDIIVMNQVIEHIDDLNSLKLKIDNLLNKGGVILIETPNLGSLQSRIFKNNWGGWHAPRHFNIFSIKSIDRLFRNYKIIKINSIPSPFNWSQSLNQKFKSNNSYNAGSFLPLILCIIIDGFSTLFNFNTGNRSYILTKTI